MRHLRSLIAALAVLALGAGIATAHPMPTASDFGLGTAGTASGQTLPADDLSTLRDAQEQSDVNQAPDATPPSDTHGAAVSSAAQGPTPTDGSWANHGQYVRSVATDNAGQQQASQHTTLPSAVPSPDAAPPVPGGH